MEQTFSNLRSALLSGVRRAVLWKSYMPCFHPWPIDVGSSNIVRCFGGVKSKKFLHANLPVCLMVSLSLDDNHAMSLVFLLLISVRRRMDAECQLFLKHLFPANNSLCRCLVLAEGSPIASSLLTQNNNADECHLLVMFFSPIVSQALCFCYRGNCLCCYYHLCLMLCSYRERTA